MNRTEIFSLRRKIEKSNRIDSQDYFQLKKMHAQMEDPKASVIYRFIAAWERWLFWAMPINHEELILLKENWPYAKRVQTKG